MSEVVCSDRTMFFYMFGFYTAWMMGIAALAYQKLKGFDDYATHFVGRKDYGVVVMMLTMFASWISGNTITNVPNASSALGCYINAAYCRCYVLAWLVMGGPAGQAFFRGTAVELLLGCDC